LIWTPARGEGDGNSLSRAAVWDKSEIRLLESIRACGLGLPLEFGEQLSPEADVRSGLFYFLTILRRTPQSKRPPWRQARRKAAAPPMCGQQFDQMLT
jgi:hypothetical protein